MRDILFRLGDEGRFFRGIVELERGDRVVGGMEVMGVDGGSGGIVDSY